MRVFGRRSCLKMRPVRESVRAALHKVGVGTILLCAASPTGQRRLGVACTGHRGHAAGGAREKLGLTFNLQLCPPVCIGQVDWWEGNLLCPVRRSLSQTSALSTRQWCKSVQLLK